MPFWVRGHTILMGLRAVILFPPSDEGSGGLAISSNGVAVQQMTQNPFERYADLKVASLGASRARRSGGPI